jgi:flavin-dependent thymidylate synthase
MTNWKKVDEAGNEWEPVYKEVLDHGFVGLVDFMGDDGAVVSAARVSYGRGTVATRSDEGLIRYLMRHYHSTPFEMCEVKLHVKAPVFVFRQWHRHRTWSYNEYSGRYSMMDKEMYVPHYDKTSSQSTNNKQGRDSDGLLTPDDYNAVRTALEHVNETSYQTYLYMAGPDVDGNQPAAPDEIEQRRKTIESAALSAIAKSRQEQLEKPEDERYIIGETEVETIVRDWFIQSGTHVITDEYPGIARELARIVLPLSLYSQMYAKVNLMNLFKFLRLRADPHAQYEIRVYADEIIEMVKPYFPMAFKAFEDYQQNSTQLSAMETMLIRATRSGIIDLGDDDAVTECLEAQGCSKREIKEFLDRY